MIVKTFKSFNESKKKEIKFDVKNGKIESNKCLQDIIDLFENDNLTLIKESCRSYNTRKYGISVSISLAIDSELISNKFYKELLESTKKRDRFESLKILNHNPFIQRIFKLTGLEIRIYQINQKDISLYFATPEAYVPSFNLKL